MQQTSLVSKNWNQFDQGLTIVYDESLLDIKSRPFSKFCSSFCFELEYILSYQVRLQTLQELNSKLLNSKLSWRGLGVNLINILHSPFLYKSAFWSFPLITVWLRDFLPKGYRRKSCSYNVDEIDYRWSEPEMREWACLWQTGSRFCTPGRVRWCSSSPWS